MPKIYNGKKKAPSINGSGLTGCLKQKNENRPIFVTFHKAHVQLDQGPQHKTRYTQSNRRQSGKEFELLGTGESFLNRTPMVRALRIDK